MPKKLTNRAQQLSIAKPGGRSAKAIQALQENGYKGKLLNLKGGITAWSDEVDSSVPKY